MCFEKVPGAARLGRLGRIIGLLTLLSVLQSCGIMKIAYNQAHELAYWQLDSYFDFDEAQSPRAREELAKVHQWHRKTQLPVYAETLQKWQALMPGDLDEAQVCRMYTDARTKLLAISERSESAAISLVGTLVPDQLDHVKRKFTKLNKEYRNDFMDGTPQDLLDKRVKKAVSRAEMLYGPLEDKQLGVLRARIAQSPFNAGLSLGEHQRRQQDALQTLTPVIAGQSTTEQAAAAVKQYFARSINSPDAAYRSYQERLTRDNCKTLAELHNSTTPAQRTAAVQTLQTYAKDFAALAAQRP